MKHESHTSGSALAFDLALSKVTLAALRRQEQLSVSEKDRESAQYVAQMIEHRLSNLDQNTNISVDVVPNQAMRAQLEHALATMPIIEKGYIQQKSDTLRELLPLLNEFARNNIADDRVPLLLTKLLAFSSSSNNTAK